MGITKDMYVTWPDMVLIVCMAWTLYIMYKIMYYVILRTIKNRTEATDDVERLPSPYKEHAQHAKLMEAQI